MLPTMSRWPTKPQCRQVQFRPLGFFLQSHRGQWLLVPRSLPLKHTMPTRSHFSWRYCLSLPYSHCAIRWLWWRPLFSLRTPVRIAHIERLYPLRSAEVDHLPRPLVPQVAHPAFFLAEFACLGVLQAAPTLRAFRAAGLQASKPPQRHVVASLEATDTAPGDDQPLASRSRHRCLVDLAQVDGSLYHRGSRADSSSAGGVGMTRCSS